MRCCACAELQGDGAVVVSRGASLTMCVKCALNVSTHIYLTPDLFVACKADARFTDRDHLFVVIRSQPVLVPRREGECAFCGALLKADKLAAHLTAECQHLRFTCAHCGAASDNYKAARNHLNRECSRIRCESCAFSGSAPAFLRHRLTSLIKARLQQLSETLNHSYRRDLLSSETFALGAQVGTCVNRALGCVGALLNQDPRTLKALEVLPPVDDLRVAGCDARMIAYEGL